MTKHFKKCSNKRDERTSSAVNAALGGLWHEVRTHKAFTVGETCVRCQEEPEDLSHILFRCPHWHKERREVQLSADDESSLMKLFWLTGQVLSQSGRMVQ
eukprot:1631929-Amphidinium_carterae.1